MQMTFGTIQNVLINMHYNSGPQPSSVVVIFAIHISGGYIWRLGGGLNVGELVRFMTVKWDLVGGLGADRMNLRVK